MFFILWFGDVVEMEEGKEEEEEAEEKEDGGRGVGRPFWVCVESKRWLWPLPVWVGFWNFKEPLATEGIKEVEWVGRPVGGLIELEGTEALVDRLGKLVLSPLDTELLFPEVEEKAGIFEADRIGEIAL